MRSRIYFGLTMSWQERELPVEGKRTATSAHSRLRPDRPKYSKIAVNLALAHEQVSTCLVKASATQGTCSRTPAIAIYQVPEKLVTPHAGGEISARYESEEKVHDVTTALAFHNW